MHQRITLAEETAGYLAADHTIRRVSPQHRGATAILILNRFPANSDFDRGYRDRLAEFAAAPTTPQR
ncbi:hypothetical protein AB4Z55_26340 [Gordonia sp. ABKF26]|jgi:hypothetical protein|uniref:hypothetical protein n=1 Tax=Gordonia sp. ABKF26 TaxID=3238687 RepID=UPI0034E40621